MNLIFERLMAALGLHRGDPVAEARARLLRRADAHETTSPSHAADLRAAALACADREPA